jgi:membrane associated rhomboid family serine protease
MAELTVGNLETVLRLIADAGPNPWYPKLHADSSGVSRDSLDTPLEKLRLAGLIRLTDWVKDRGQGYLLTPEGVSALKDGKTLARVRDGKISQPSAKPVAKPHWSSWDRGEAIREVFLDPPNPVVAKTILFITVLLFFAGMYAAWRGGVPPHIYLYGSARTGHEMTVLLEVKHNFGAIYAPDLILGQWWRLLTHLFVHHGGLHLLMNMFALYGLSRYLEPMWGRTRFLIIYLVAGWGGGCAAMIFSSGGLLGGASGAICGLLAAECVWIVLNRAYLPSPLFRAFMQNILINSILLVIISIMPGISASAHFGGAAVGAAAAVFLHFQRYGTGLVRWLAPIGIMLVFATCTGALIYTMHHSAHWLALEEAIKKVLRKDEYVQLRDRFRADALPAFQESERAIDRAMDEVLQSNPARRDAQKKEEALANLAQVQEKLKAASKAFEAGLVTKDETNQEARNVVLELLEAQAELLGMVAKYIKEDVNLLNQAETDLNEQKRTVENLASELRHFGMFPGK